MLMLYNPMIRTITLNLFIWAVVVAAQTPVYQLLYTPPATTPGGNPTVMFAVSPGVFIVITDREGSSWGASVVSVTSAATYKVIYSLPPYAISTMLVQATNGLVYGPAFLQLQHSSYNFYFSLTPSAQEQQYAVPGGWGSAWQTVVVPPNNLYDILAMKVPGGTTYAFAQIQETGKINILHQFSATDGFPVGTNMVYASDGNLYGVGNQKSGDWQNQGGFIYRFTQAGAYSQLLSFPTFHAGGRTIPLIAASDGNLYGLFNGGGTNGRGQLYQATLSGQLQTVASFPSTGMAAPQTLMQAADGNIYGSTEFNSMFRYNLASKQLSLVYQMAADGSQGQCPCQLVEGMDGQLYGVTPSGGPPPNIGALFSLDIGLPKPLPVISGMFPAAASIGQQVILWGNYLLGATSVSFNGVPAATVSVTSVQSVIVTVPTGATTGPLTVTTANGSFTTTQKFTVK
jgi:hypothetical protein